MPTGVGIDAMTVGGNIVGRTALDDRMLVRSGFHNLGIVMGCRVTGSATAMAYVLDSGADPVSVAVASRGGADGATTFPIASGTVTTTAAPASGSRIDLIWARQNDPSKGDADNLVTSGVTQGNAAPTPVAPALPAGAVELARALVPSGATRGSATTLTPGPRAIPYGASLGVLHSFRDVRNSALPDAVETVGAGSFVLPTARTLEFRIMPSLMPTASGARGAQFFRAALDDIDRATFVAQVDGASTQTFIWTAEVPAGEHTVAYKRLKRDGQSARGLYGAYQGEVYQGTVFQVIDLGAA
ncbi:hypothetical protein EG850_10940 [Gulosibacter macacae]|uniref:Uncharacterized protein n=1 Tax=Gulosibacter macacae TaxID=2488791 RepID=A0A3P3VU96_9MICO|nr:hypothetical protein [Gulosibacter macacae]RRJ85897.1 hypothetical protein EG850_10940 [Gulosibacter macacae]